MERNFSCFAEGERFSTTTPTLFQKLYTNCEKYLLFLTTAITAESKGSKSVYVHYTTLKINYQPEVITTINFTQQ